jgi:cytoskeletal protein CcmA (bactofilin family)
MARNQPNPDITSINMIGQGSEVEGTFRSTRDVRVNGKITGDLIVEGKVIVAEQGLIDGTVTAKSADVAGSIKGELTVEDRLILKSSASVEGEIRTGRLVVEEGAVFEGNCSMGRLDPARKAAMGDGVDGVDAKTDLVIESGKKGR